MPHIVGDFVRYVGGDGKYHYRVIDQAEESIAAVIDSWFIGPWRPHHNGGQTADMAPLYHWAVNEDFEIVDENVFHTDMPPQRDNKE